MVVIARVIARVIANAGRQVSTLAFLVTVVGSGCATTTTFTGPSTDAHLVVDGHDYGAFSGDVQVPAPAGPAPLRWQIVDDGGNELARGLVPRSEPVWPIVVGAAAGATCCVPSAMALGFCLANPALLAAPLVLLTNNIGSIVVAFQAPGWATVPMTSIGALTGSAPLLLGLVAQRPPDRWDLSPPPLPSSSSSSSSPDEGDEAQQPISDEGRDATSQTVSRMVF